MALQHPPLIDDGPPIRRLCSITTISAPSGAQHAPFPPPLCAICPTDRHQFLLQRAQRTPRIPEHDPTPGSGPPSTPRQHPQTRNTPHKRQRVHTVPRNEHHWTDLVHVRASEHLHTQSKVAVDRAGCSSDLPGRYWKSHKTRAAVCVVAPLRCGLGIMVMRQLALMGVEKCFFCPGCRRCGAGRRARYHADGRAWRG